MLKALSGARRLSDLLREILNRPTPITVVKTGCETISKEKIGLISELTDDKGYKKYDRCQRNDGGAG